MYRTWLVTVRQRAKFFLYIPGEIKGSTDLFVLIYSRVNFANCSNVLRTATLCEGNMPACAEEVKSMINY